VKFLLDSTVVIALLRGDQTLIQRIQTYAPGDLAMPSIVAHELFYGAHKSRRAQTNLALIEALQLPVLEFDWEDARRGGELRAHLAAGGTPIGPYDVLIAGQALARDLILVTHNGREFQRVPGLMVEDWQSA
jgi:tRNA(fMet)-specific endonuclease VapC